MGFYGRETKICIEGILVGHLGLFPQAFDVIVTTKQIYKCLHYVYTIGELKFFPLISQPHVLAKECF